MELGQLLKLFSEDPAGRLFKADNAPFVVDERSTIERLCDVDSSRCG
jgi:hypothetical protein